MGLSTGIQSSTDKLAVLHNLKVMRLNLGKVYIGNVASANTGNAHPVYNRQVKPPGKRIVYATLDGTGVYQSKNVCSLRSRNQA